MNHLKRLGMVMLLAGSIAGCATTGQSSRDPIEPINRAIFGFNEGVDNAIIKPVAEGYRAVVPGLLRTGVTNFFSNVEDVWIAVNNLLQGKVEEGLGDVMRVAINTTFGLLGVIDVASDAGLDKHNEDFGQTLGRWGLGSGPYLVLPFFGPSSLRDGVGWMFDSSVDPVANIGDVGTRNTAYVVRVADRRANALDATQLLEEAAIDKYTFTRESYLQRRRSQVYDGRPPRDESDAEPSDQGPREKRPEPDAPIKQSEAEDFSPALAETGPVPSPSGAPALAGSTASAFKTNN
ncbi:MAG: VacJ family lipoprotein [Betaproteobacteria bacterium]|nr:VacJ family lipoprotein [Betaproteobacteria bacterium]